MTSDPLGVVLLTDTPEGTVAWRVSYNTGADGRLLPPRLSGAWSRVDSMLIDRLSRGYILLDDAHAETDLGALASAVHEVQRELDGAHKEANTAKRSLVPPRWWPIPALNLAEPETFGTPVAMRLAVARATWAERLLRVWVHTESTRVGKKYMRPHGGPSPRLYPSSWPPIIAFKQSVMQ